MNWAFAGDVVVLSDTDPSAIGTVAGAGNGAAASRDDHVHVLGDGSISVAATIASNVVTVDKIKHGEVDANHIGALNGAWDFNGHQAIDLIVHQSSTAPASPVIGMLWQDTDDQKLYVCTAV